MSKKYFDLEQMNDNLLGVMSMLTAFGFRLKADDLIGGEDAQAMFLMENVVRNVQTELQQLINQGSGLIRREENESADKVSE